MPRAGTLPFTALPRPLPGQDIACGACAGSGHSGAAMRRVLLTKLLALATLGLLGSGCERRRFDLPPPSPPRVPPPSPPRLPEPGTPRLPDPRTLGPHAGATPLLPPAR